MRAGWAAKKIGDVIEKSGTIDPRKNSAAQFRYVDVSSVSRKSNQIEEVATVYGADAPSRARRLIKSGDVIFATIRPTLQRIAQVPEELDGQVCSTGYFVFRTKPEVNSRYLYYYLFSAEFMDAMESLQSGASYPAVNDSQVKSQTIPIPPLAEQTRIVAVLDEAFEGIAVALANTEKNLANARELFETTLNDTFTQKGEDWVETTLGEITFVASGGTPLKSTPIFWGGDIPWYSSGELNHEFTENSLKCITPEGLNGSNAKLFPKGSLLIGMYDTAAMKMAILDRDAAYNQAVAGLKPSIDDDLRFVKLALEAKKPEILEQRRGTRQKNLSLKKIKNISIPLPPLAEQKRIVQKLDDFRSQTQCLEALYQQKIDALNELKQSLLQKAFSGELTADIAEAVVVEAVA
jgi:type I restriction enzyme, S subunit